MLITPEMRSVILKIWVMGINRDFISPNLVAEIADDIKVQLTSYQIVYISDNFI
jgi:hypothetical protein